MFNLHKLFAGLTNKKEKVMPERVKQAQANLPKEVLNLSTQALAAKINKMNQPNKWAITRAAASGRLHHTSHGGNHYPPNYTSPQRQRRIARAIEKGMIQITPDREYKSSKTPEWIAKQEELKQQRMAVLKEGVDEGNSKILQ